MIKPDLFVAPIKIKNCFSLIFFSVFTIIQQEELMGWHLSGVTRTRILVIGLNFSEFLSQEKERRFSFESAGNSSHATCHFANSFLLLPSPFQKWNVFLFIESWSRDQLMQKARPVNLTWKLAIFRRRVFLTRLGLRFTYVNQACRFESNHWSTCRRSIGRKTWNKQKLVGNIWLYIIKYSYD